MPHDDNTVELLVNTANTLIAKQKQLEDAVVALQRKVGTDDSEDPTSLDYAVAGLTEITHELQDTLSAHNHDDEPEELDA